MTFTDKFSEAEWATVLEAPMLAGFAITAADPGGLISAVQESAAMAGSLRSAATDGGEGSLAYAVAEAYKTPEGRKSATGGIKELVKGKRPAEASEASVAKLGEIIGLIDRTVPDQSSGFREFLMDTATKTAEASTEGGFLGFGGEKVSDAERKTLDDLRAVLGTAGA